jgi:hypothetical protein
MGREEMIESLQTVNAAAAKGREARLSSVARLMRVALGDTGQCRRVADFLLAWHNAEENGGWDPTDLWSVDSAIADEILTALRLLLKMNRYSGDLGFQKEIDEIWQLWRGGKRSNQAEVLDM